MEVAVLIFLSSGLFLGWSLGGNDAANVFGTAVGSKMVRFSTAAIVCAVFVILGAVVSGAGAAHGLGRLGAVNALPGAFMVALSAAVAVYWMTRLGLPVSVTQAIVGAIIGWNIYSGSITDLGTLSKIMSTWLACPILGAAFAAVLYKVVVGIVKRVKFHVLTLDLWTRIGLVAAGAFGAYALGANNIANVVGVFVTASPFGDVNVAGLFTLTAIHQLFLVGGVAIGVGVFYSRKVMMTVGDRIMPVSSVGAWVVVVAHSLVLLVFSSVWLEGLLLGSGLPAIPLIPVSSSQAVVGAVIGIGLVRGTRGLRQIQWRVLGSIGLGWVCTPIIAAVLCFLLLFFLQHVFRQDVYKEVYYRISQPVLARLGFEGIPLDALQRLRKLEDQRIAKGLGFRAALRQQVRLPEAQEKTVIARARIQRITINPGRMQKLDSGYLSKKQAAAVRKLVGRTFDHRWQLDEALVKVSMAWRVNQWVAPKPRDERLAYVARLFAAED
jgi:PiT family inorganic phosphate transporter